jgi:pyoverdine/dityrosine biosynthesis protein Dit1
MFLTDLSPFHRINCVAAQSDAAFLAGQILREVLKFRRSVETEADSETSAAPACDPGCRHCASVHLPKIIAAIEANQPIKFVLPAFPGKSPNFAKVLSPLPDLAEQLALQFLQNLSARIKDLYAPGAQIILCADGRVFSDIVGMREQDVTDYQADIEKQIDDLQLTDLTTFHLDQWTQKKNYAEVREILMQKFGVPLSTLQEKVRRGANAESDPADAEANRMYRGITRFLVEDSTFDGQSKSRTAIQKECKARAYEVIRRSNAWSELLSERFPEAIRLSIHPQKCGSRKIGLRLIANETWMTPWHGVAVKVNNEYTLLKRREAEELGAELIFASNGRPSLFEVRK